VSTLDHLKRKLDSPDSEERREAAVDLGRRGAPAVTLLLQALGDRDWRVRKTAVEALVTIDGPEVINGLVHCLSSEDNAGARNSSIEALVQVGAGAVEPLLPLLTTADADVRKFVIDILGEIRDSRSVPELMQRLHDHDENVRVAAAEALGKIRDRRAVDALIACLSTYEQGWLDYAAAEALGEIGDQRALGPLLGALGRSSLREPVLESLGKIGNLQTLPPLLQGLSDPLRIVREVSATALATIQKKISFADRPLFASAVRTGISDRAVDFLDEMIDTSGGDLQKAAIAVIGWSGRASGVPHLLALLRDEDMEGPVLAAVRSVGADAVPVLLEGLNDEQILVRQVAATVLGDLGRREAEDALIAMLEDENGHVRGSAAEALGKLRSRRGTVPLIALLEDEYENVQECAIRAIAAIGDETVLDGLLADFFAKDAGMRRNIVRLLGRFGSSRALDALVFAIKDEESEVRKAVVIALDGVPSDRAEKPLLVAITDDDPEVRMLAAEGLARSGATGAADALIPLLDDEDLWVRASAARGLGRLGGERYGSVLAAHLSRASDIFLLALVEVLGRSPVAAALEPLLQLADHHDPEVRKTVLQALKPYDWAGVRPVMLRRLADEHWSVRKAAAEALQLRTDPEVEELFERMADEDPDPAVRQTVREALKR
jgi:HEAT repeat protein